MLVNVRLVVALAVAVARTDGASTALSEAADEEQVAEEADRGASLVCRCGLQCPVERAPWQNVCLLLECA